MRKTLLLICFIIITLHQSYGQSISFDISAGPNTSTYAEKESPQGKAIPNYLQSTIDSYIQGYHVGALAKLNLKNVGIQTGLLYTKKGGDDIATSQIPNLVVPVFYQEYGHRTLNYLEIPLNITYNFHVAYYTLFIGGGPYMELGLGGKYNSSYIGTDYTGTTTGTRSSNIGFGYNGDIKTPAYGVNILGGVSFKNGFSFSAGYAFGVTNVTQNTDYISKNKSIDLSVAYTLFTKKLK